MKKFLKKMVCGLLSLVCVCSGVSAFASCNSAAEKLTREIYTVQDFLEHIEEYRDKEHKGMGKRETTVGSFRLMADLDFTGIDYEPLLLQMDFDGNGHALNNITINAYEEYNYGVGIFYSNVGKSVATIKNLTVNNLFINYTGKETPVGGLLGYYHGNRHETKNDDGEEITVYEAIENVKINGKINAPQTSYVGGLIGESYMGVVKNCEVMVDVVGGNYTGGIIGGNKYDSEITQTQIYDSVNNGSVKGGEKVGGVIGRYGMIYDCSNTGEVSGKENVGGIVGSTDYDIEGCTNSGNITGTSANKINGSSGGKIEDGDEHAQVGGIVGEAIGYGALSDCKNTGVVKGSYDRIGGIAGYCTREVVNCQNEGSVTGDDDVGGIIGCWKKEGSLTKCRNKGNVTANVGGGGLVGNIAATKTVKLLNCESGGLITVDAYGGGLVGRSYATIDEDYITTNNFNGELDCGSLDTSNQIYNKIK